jgi:hypothetical protein
VGIGQQSHARDTRRDLLGHRQPLAEDARLVLQEAGQITAWARQAFDETCTDWIGDVHEHDRDRAGLTLQRGSYRRRMCEDDAHGASQTRVGPRSRIPVHRVGVDPKRNWSDRLFDDHVSALLEE